MSVVSTLQSQPPMVSDELRRQADQFIDLVDLQKDIARTNGPRQQRPPVTPSTQPDDDLDGDFDDDYEDEDDYASA